MWAVVSLNALDMSYGCIDSLLKCICGLCISALNIPTAKVYLYICTYVYDGKDY